MKRIIVTLAVLFLFVALPVYAQQANPSDKLFVDFSGYSTGNSVQSVLTYLTYAFLGLASTVSMLYLIYGGYMYLTAGVNADQATQARKIIKNSLIGLIVMILSYIIITVVVNSLLRL